MLHFSCEKHVGSLHDVTMTISLLLQQLEQHKLPTIDLKLDRVKYFLKCIGNPHHSLPPVIHVAGTNAKGSVIAFAHEMLKQAGKTAHRYTSPHLVRFNERIMLNNHIIDDNQLERALERMIEQQKEHHCPLTYFESTTITALQLFAHNSADAVFLEVGLGGRLDATNVIDAPSACIITPIGMDHQAYLGDTLALIAVEKAAIIKHGVPVIVSRQEAEAAHVIAQQAHVMHAPLYRLGVEWDYKILSDGRLHYISDTLDIVTPAPSMLGVHQYDNAACAIALMDVIGASFDVSNGAIIQGVEHAHWMGRLQELPLHAYNVENAIYVDGGHNPHAAKALQEWCITRSHPIHIICGMRDDKDADKVIAILASKAASITAITIPNDPQSLPAHKIYEIAKHYHNHVFQAHTVEQAVQNISKKYGNLHEILITGSLYLTGAVLGDVL